MTSQVSSQTQPSGTDFQDCDYQANVEEKQVSNSRAKTIPNILVYTVIVGGYDIPLPIPTKDPQIRYIVYADRKPRSLVGWQWEPLPQEVRHLSPIHANRWCKFFPHKIDKTANVSIYLDGNIKIARSLKPLLKEFETSGATLGLFRHPERTDLFLEAEACKRFGKISESDAETLEVQLSRYKAGGISAESLLTENGVILRKHSCERMRSAMELWWEELLKGVPRDQISLPWVRFRTKVPTQIWSHYHGQNRYFIGPFRHVTEDRGSMRRLLHFALANYSGLLFYRLKRKISNQLKHHTRIG